MTHRALVTAWFVLYAATVNAQQRPLVTEDPEPIGAGRILIEGGIEGAHNQQYPVSGLEGNLWRLPTLGVSIGISSIAELQIDGSPFNHLAITNRVAAPLSSLVTVVGTSTHDVEDLIIGTKIRLMAESPSHPALGIRFATQLPNARNETGLGIDVTNFFASLLVAKTIQSVRVVGNIGIGILGDPTSGSRQNDDVTYGLSFARALTERAEVVGEVNGRASTRSAGALPGTESRSLLKLGGRYTRGSVRFDGGLFFGLTTVDPTIGLTAGFTYVFSGFTLP